MRHFHELFAALFVEGRHGDPDQLAVIRRRESQVGREDRFLNGLQQTAVPGLHRQQPRFRGRHARDLIQGHLAAVCIHANEIEQGGRGLPRAHGRELALDRVHGFAHGHLHLFGMIGEGHWTMVPTRSPASTLAVAPGWFMLNTTIGNRFSLHKPNAFASITA